MASVRVGVRAVVITGTPGVGKSTVCQALAGGMALAAHVEADVLHRMIVSGGQWPGAGTPEAFDQLLLRTRNAATVAANLLDAGIPVFVDEVISSRQQLATLHDVLPGAHVVLLHADPDVVLERDRRRTKHTAATYLGAAPLIREVAGDGIVIDSTELDVVETVARVREALGL